MLRLLVTLTVVQILALGLLAVELMGLQDEVQRLSATSSGTVPTMSGPPPGSSTTDGSPEPATILVATEQSLDDIRFVVREELAYALAELAIASGEVTARAPALSEEESLERLYEATSTIDAYTQQGQMSDRDMAGLQQQIAKLNPEHRYKALRYLARAMNSGQLRARL